MRRMIGEGKTIDSAIENALEKLGTTREQVDIEVIQEPGSGVFGWKSTPAKVRLTVKKKETPVSDLATVSVQEGELFLATSPAAVPARIRFGAELHVIYKGEVMQGEVMLTDGLEPLEIVLPEMRDPSLTYEVRVNEEKTKAELFWKRSPGVVYQLADKGATNQLELTLEKTLIEPPYLSLEELAEIVRVEGLNTGLKISEISPEVLTASQGLITLAEGIEPINPTQPTIAYVFQDDSPQVDLDALRIDYYEVHGIQGVKPGAVLAVKTPGEPGLAGRNVYGEEIPVEPVEDVELLVGEGVTLSEDGLKAIATASGLPVLQSGVVKVTNVFELEGDADVSTGNITMDGAIIIKGNVLESVKVESDVGNIVVNGLVSGATLRTGGSITVLKNVIRSQISAGGQTVTQIRLLGLLFRIREQFEDLIKAYNAIVSQADNIPFENLLKHLLELKFFNLPEDITEFVGYVRDAKKDCTPEVQRLSLLLEEAFEQVGPVRLGSIDELAKLLAAIRAQEKALEALVAIESDATVGYLQNSHIEASRYIEITGKGCFYSRAVAGKGFKIAQGVVRGGEVYVNEGNIEAKEFGGPTGIATSFTIVKEGRISASLVHPNVTLSIAEQSFTFGDTASQVKAFLHNGLMTVYSGSNKIHG